MASLLLVITELMEMWRP